VYSAVYRSSSELVTACGDGAVRIWDPERGQMMRELRLRGRAPRWYVVAVSGERIAAVDTKGTIAAAWDAETGAVLAEFELNGDGWPAIEFSADGQWLAVSGGDVAHVTSTSSWRSAAVLPVRRVHALAWDPAGPRVVTGSTTGDLSVWNAPDGARIEHLRAVGEPVDAVAWSPDGTKIVAGIRGGAEQVFSAGALVSAGNLLHGKLTSIEFSPDGQRVVAAAASGLVAISEVATGAQVAVFDAPLNAARAARFSPDGRRIAGATWDGIAWIWSASAPYQRWSAPAQAETCGLFGGAEPDGRYLAVACVGHPTRVWDTARDALLAELPALEDSDRVPYPVVSPSGDLAAIARGTVAEAYALPRGELLWTAHHGAAVTALAITAAGELVSGSADGRVLVTRGDETSALAPAGGPGIDALAVLPGGRIVAADARGRAGELVSGSLLWAPLGARARSLRPSPDGRYLLAVPSYAGKTSPPTLVDFDRDTAVDLEGPQVYTARWTPAGILTAHADGAARLWDRAGHLIRVLRGNRGFLVDAALTPDGMVVGAASDGALRFWDASTGTLIWSPVAHIAHPFGISAGPWGIVTRGSGGEMSRWVVPDAASVIGDGKAANTLPFR